MGTSLSGFTEAILRSTPNLTYGQIKMYINVCVLKSNYANVIVYHLVHFVYMYIFFLIFYYFYKLSKKIAYCMLTVMLKNYTLETKAYKFYCQQVSKRQEQIG